MEGANTLAYYNTATITAVKSFIVQTPGVHFIISHLISCGLNHKTFYSRNLWFFVEKLQCLSLANLSSLV
jgi:hypothetical protein